MRLVFFYAAGPALVGWRILLIFEGVYNYRIDYTRQILCVDDRSKSLFLRNFRLHSLGRRGSGGSHPALAPKGTLVTGLERKSWKTVILGSQISLRPKFCGVAACSRGHRCCLRAKKSEKNVSGRRNKDTRAAGLSPYTMIDGISFGTYVIAGKNLLGIDHEFAME